MTTIIGPIDVEEMRPVFFDFSRELKTGETLSAIVSIEVMARTDPNPQDLLIGPAVISGSQVRQMVRSSILNASYHMRAVVTTSLGSQLVVPAYLRVILL